MFLLNRLLKIVLCAWISTILASPVFSADLFVPQDYTTIQDAVDAAQIGDVIIVSDGTYVENVSVNKTITLRSENGTQNTFVEASNSSSSVFSINADQVTVEGFTVTGATGSIHSSGFWVSAAGSRCTLLNNVIGTPVSPNAMGVWLVANTGSRLEGNIVAFNNWSGINIVQSSGLTIKDNTVMHNNSDGIHCEEMESSLITGNVIEQQSNSNREGLNLRESSSNRITNNTFSENCCDIYIFDGSTNNQVFGNTLLNAQYNSIYLSEGADNIISKNIVTGCGGAGIYAYTEVGARISQNTVTQAGYGIYFQSVTESRVYANTCNNNGIAGLILTSTSSENILFQNTSSGNAYGAYISDSTDNRIFLSSFSGNSTNIHSSNATTFWQDAQQTAYMFEGAAFTGFLGNFYSDHDLTDSNGDGITDLPKDQPGIDSNDNYPLAMEHTFFIPISPDMDADMDVDGLDIANFASALAAGGDAADLNQDTIINTSDIELFSSAFGQ